MLLVDDFPLDKLQILEDDASKGRLVIGGRFQLAETPNANKRVYTKSLWEKLLAEEKLIETLNARRMLGLVEHPKDGKTNPLEASHVVTSLALNENNEIIGRAEILNTPNGLILQELFRAGCQMGISSRGTGTLTKGAGCDYVNEDFNLQTFDIVLTPSTPQAYPKPLSESIEDYKENNDMATAHEKYLALEQRATTIIEADVSNDAGKKLVESAATKLIVELSGASNEDPSLKEIIAPLIEDLNEKRKSLRKPINEDAQAQTFTQGSADQGFIRTVPQIPPPPPGEGWLINPNDPGILAGYTDNVNPWMQGATEAGGAPIHVEAEDEEEAPQVTEAKKKKKKKHPSDCTCPACSAERGESEASEEGESEEQEERENKVTEEVRDQFMTEFAAQVVELPESEENAPFRALAAAYLLEKDERINEAEAYQRVVGKIQEKLADAEKTGKLVVESTDELLEQKYNVSLHIIEELKNRLKLLSAKVYAEQQLESIGKRGDKNARQIMAEAIKKDASKASLDEAFLAIKGLKPLGLVNNVNSKAITESVNKVEAAVSNLNESSSPSRGMAVNDVVSRLSRNMTSARSL